MRRFVGLTVLTISLAVPATALALVAAASDDGAVSVKNGLGKVVLSPFNGSAVGRLGSGVIKLTDPIFGDGAGFDVWGCDSQPVKTDTTEVCTGENIRFRAVGGKYKIFIKGSGIFLSAVGHGTVTLDGRGDDPSVESDGVFSINDSPYRSLPNLEKQFQLATPSDG
jgi:hypothetical protein